MSLIDVLLLSGVLVAGTALLFAARRKALRLGLLVLIALAAPQFALEGYYWQFTPSYLVLLLVGLGAWRGSTSTRGWTRRLGQFGLLALMLLSLAPWALLPVPRLTQPAGRYAVGTQVFRWTDTSRPEPATPERGDRRNVVVQAWYPRAGHAPGPHSAYIDGLGRLPRSVSLLPGFMLRAYGQVDTHAVPAAPLSPDRRQWPVVVFSPGYGASRAFYTSLVADLASRGYVVLALDHPYESAITELADGRLATPRETFLPNDPDRRLYMVGQQEVRAGDVAFVVDQLARPNALGPRLAGRLDLDHVGAIGHSFGGATSAVAAARDPRIKAAANVDGSLYGTASNQRLAQPFLLLESDHSETGHSARFLEGNKRLLDGLQAGGYRYEIARANHYSFTDAPLFFSGPGRFLLARVMGGSRGPAETQRATVDILAAFLGAPLSGQPLSVEAAAARYRGIAGGPVAPAAR